MKEAQIASGLALKSQSLVLKPQKADDLSAQMVPDSPNFAALDGQTPLYQFPKDGNDNDKDGSASSGELATDSDADGMEQAPDK